MSQNNTPVAPVAPAKSAAPVAPAAVTPWEALKNGLSLASAGRDFTKPAHAFDALAAFAKAAGHPFNPDRAFRDNILRLTSLANSKGKASGSAVRWSAGFNFNQALKDYVAGAEGDAKADRRDESAAMKSAASLWKALGGVAFELEN